MIEEMVVEVVDDVIPEREVLEPDLIRAAIICGYIGRARC
jgi:hypothetical protein